MGFSINKLRNIFTKTNVVLGDVNAVQKGKIVERIRNRVVWKAVGGFLSNFLK